MKTQMNAKIVSQRELDSRNEQYVRELVMQNAEGNVSLHLGQFSTQRDLDKLIEEAIAIDFSTFSK